MALNEGGASSALADPTPAPAPAGDPAAPAAPAAPAGGDPAAPAGDPAAPSPDSGANLDWLEALSAEGGDADNPSNRDYIKSKGIKSLDDLTKSYREAEKALRASGKITVPGADAKPEEVAAFRTAIGVPETADAYEVKLPDGIEGVELNTGLIDRLRAKAIEGGTPKGAFETLASELIQAQLDEHMELVQRQDTLVADTFKEWGADKPQKLADAMAAKRALGWSDKDIAGIQRVIGADRVLKDLAKLGGGMGEDVLITGGVGRFGVTPAEAQVEINKLKTDPAFQQKVRIAGSPERLRWDRLNAAIAAGKDAENRTG